MSEWFVEFFDRLYYETYSAFEDEERNKREAGFIERALGLTGRGRVLDLACGYARHAVYLGLWGYLVTCYDLSGFLLERARERVELFGVGSRVEVVGGDMRVLGLRSGGFDGVYLFFTSFGYFGDEDNETVLRGVARILRPGGRFLVDLWNPVWVMYSAYLSGGVRRTWFEVGDYVVLEETSYDVFGGRVLARRIFYRRDTGERAGVRSFQVRVYTYREMEKMLGRAGLAVERVYGSYGGEEYKPSSPRMIIVARKEEQ